MKICYQCEKDVPYLFDDSRCKDCTRLTPAEVIGEVTTACPRKSFFESLCLSCAKAKDICPIRKRFTSACVEYEKIGGGV